MAKTKGFTMTMMVNGKEYKSKGETVSEAIDNIDQNIFPAKTKAIISIEKDGLKSSLSIMPMVLKRLFGNQTLKAIWSKRFLQLMK